MFNMYYYQWKAADMILQLVLLIFPMLLGNTTDMQTGCIYLILSNGRCFLDGIVGYHP